MAISVDFPDGAPLRTMDAGIDMRSERSTDHGGIRTACPTSRRSKAPRVSAEKAGSRRGPADVVACESCPRGCRAESI